MRTYVDGALVCAVIAMVACHVGLNATALMPVGAKRAVVALEK